MGLLLLHTGNLLKSHHAKFTADPSKELLNSLEAFGANSVVNGHCIKKDFQEEPSDLQITVKLFVNVNQHADVVEEALKTTKQSLQLPYIHTAVLSIQQLQDEDNLDQEFAESQLNKFLSLWRSLEKFHESEQSTLGVTDFNEIQLRQIMDLVKARPKINQVNIHDCCALPKPLIEFAKANQIELVTHNDPPELITDQQINEILKKQSIGSGVEYKIQWLARYSILLKTRGIVHNKAYLIALSPK